MDPNQLARWARLHLETIKAEMALLKITADRLKAQIVRLYDKAGPALMGSGKERTLLIEEAQALESERNAIHEVWLRLEAEMMHLERTLGLRAQ
jgi:hypothetical protein